MSIANELADLFERDLARLIQQLEAFGGRDILWTCPPGITNSAGNLMLHLEGNLRDFVCRIVGGMAYQRVRPEEFSRKGVPVDEMMARLQDLKQSVSTVVRQTTEEQLSANFPVNPLGTIMSTRQFLIHLNGHLNYHLGQIDYLRRMLSDGAAIDYASLRQP